MSESSGAGSARASFEPDEGYTNVRDPDSVSVGTAIGEIMSDVSTLIRQEIELAKAELRVEGAKAGKGAGMLGGAAFAGWMVALFLSMALMWALGDVMPDGWAAVIVAVLWAIVGAVLFTRGRAQLKSVNPKPEQTVQTLKEDVQWAKTRNR